MIIKCPECGKLVSDKASACPNCGASLSPKTAPESGAAPSDQLLTPAPSPELKQTQEPSPAPTPTPAPEPTTKSNATISPVVVPEVAPKRKNGKKGIIAAIIVTSLVIAVGAFLLIRFLVSTTDSGKEIKEAPSSEEIVEIETVTTVEPSDEPDQAPQEPKTLPAEEIAETPTPTNVQNTRAHEGPKTESTPKAKPTPSANGPKMDEQFELGMKYYKGDGITKNMSSAFRYLKPLAEAGYVKAYFPVAEMYYRGQGVIKDKSEAEKWYRKAADAGDERAQKILSTVF